MTRALTVIILLFSLSASAADKKSALLDSFNRVKRGAVNEAIAIDKKYPATDFTPIIQEKMQTAKEALSQLIALEKPEAGEKSPYHELYVTHPNDSAELRRELLDKFSANYITALALVNAEVAKKRASVMTSEAKNRLAGFWVGTGLAQIAQTLFAWKMFNNGLLNAFYVSLVFDVVVIPVAMIENKTGPGIIPFIRYLRERLRFRKRLALRKGAMSKVLREELSEIQLLLAESNEGHEFLGFLQTANQTLCPKLLTEPKLLTAGEGR